MTGVTLSVPGRCYTARMNGPSSDNDASRDVLDALAQIDVDELTFVELRRLETALEEKLKLVAGECRKRSAADDDGDTTIQVLVEED